MAIRFFVHSVSGRLALLLAVGSSAGVAFALQGPCLKLTDVSRKACDVYGLVTGSTCGPDVRVNGVCSSATINPTGVDELEPYTAICSWQPRTINPNGNDCINVGDLRTEEIPSCQRVKGKVCPGSGNANPYGD